MSPSTRWKVFAALGGGGFALSVYAARQTVRYFAESGDTTGTIIFGGAAIFLLLVAGLHWYMAAGLKFGLLDRVTGSMDDATLEQDRRAVVASAKIQFVRKLDADNANLTPAERYVFFICSYRPWVCKEVDFQII